MRWHLDPALRGARHLRWGGIEDPQHVLVVDIHALHADPTALRRALLAVPTEIRIRPLGAFGCHFRHGSGVLVRPKWKTHKQPARLGEGDAGHLVIWEAGHGLER